jgi:hypothetical protein
MKMRDTEQEMAWGDITLLLISGVAAWCLIFLSGIF